MNYRCFVSAAALVALAVTSVNAAPAAPPASGYAPFTLDPTAVNRDGMVRTGMKYMPVSFSLSDTRPASIKKEPAYHGKPRYGTFHIGDGPNADTPFVVDEASPDDSRIFVDVNRDGDLTDDGDGAWATKNVDPKTGRISYGVNSYVLHASWGTAKKETASGSYGVAVYHTGGDSHVFAYREAARVGTLTVKGKKYRAMLVENDIDGVYSKPFDDNDAPMNGKDSRPVWLVLDLSGTGKFGFQSGIYDIRTPFVFDHTNFEVAASEDGSRVKMFPTTRALVQAPPKVKNILADGTPAPDFTAENVDGTPVKLSDYKGKVVVLDMWATWCGPCKASMPHLEKVYENTQGQDVVVLAVCVSDQRPFFRQFVSENKDDYKFHFAYDPAGTTDGATKISGDLYGVSGIPTTFVIDRDGKIAEGIVGYGGPDDHHLEAALAKLGVTIAAPEKAVASN